MTKHLVNIIRIPILYNILDEIKHLFGFNICSYENPKDFLVKVKGIDIKNSILILSNNHDSLFINDTFKNNILILDVLPLKLEKILDKINTTLIKKTYFSRSNLNIKGYVLDFNSKHISYLNKKLKLTEKEIEIILFLNKAKNSQNISILEKEIWGYASKLETHTVETHIYRLRKKFKENFSDDNFITNFDNGYKI
jgi:DNA-binding response OmpR family regulator